MAPERRKLLILILAVVVLASALTAMYRADTTAPAAGGTAAAGPRASNGRARGGSGAQAIAAPDVHLDALDADRPRPSGNDRNLFHFQPKASPPPPRPVVAPSGPVQPPPPARSGPPPAPSVPPIPLKFVGFIETGRGEKIASLSDGRGVAIGKEGDIVLGRYKIWRIGEESVEVSYVDGTGRITIRLTGQ